MAVGISCGVYSFMTAIIGTVGFSIVAFLLRFSPYSKQQSLLGNLKFSIPFGEELPDTFKQTLKKHCRNSSLNKYRFLKDIEGVAKTEFQYKLQLKKEMDGIVLLQALESLEGLSDIRITFSDAYSDIND